MHNNNYFCRDINFSDNTELEKCLRHFCTNGNASLNYQNFKKLMSNILTDSQGKSFYVPEVMLTELFTTFDRNSDGEIDVSEFETVWNDFLKPLLRPVTALLIIDVQNDFIEGSLALRKCPAKQEGKDVIPVINTLLGKCKFDVVVYTLDYHPKNHISFIENVGLYKFSVKDKDLDKIEMFDTVIFEGPPKMEQKLWPTHCVQDTWGCKLHENLKQIDNSLFIYKGKNPQIDSYSAFFDNLKASCTDLHEELKKRSVTHVFICGVALDYCVAFTALDAIELGYATSVIQDAAKGTDGNCVRDTVDKLLFHNCVLTDSQEVESLLNGSNRKVEFMSVLLNAIKKN